MKKSLIGFKTLLTALLLLLISCSKSPSPAPAEPETSLRFKMNGTLYEWKNKGWCGFYCGTGFIKWPAEYKLSSIDPGSGLSALSCTIAAANLSASTYNYVVAVPVNNTDALHRLSLYSPVSSGSLNLAASTETGDYFTITITSLHDGKYADGVFTARLTQAPYGSAAPKADITEGEFRNVVIYQ